MTDDIDLPGKDELSTLIKWFEASEDATMTSRQLAERDRDYYDTKQLTSKEIKGLESRGQPVIQINRIRPKIDFMLGAEIQGRTDPHAAPRTPKDEDASYAITDALRFVVDKENFDMTRTAAQKNMIVEGIGICEVVVEPKFNADPEIKINPISWDRFFADPHSRDLFFKDARYMGQVIWADRDQAVLMADNPEEAKTFIEAEFASARTSNSNTYDDKPTYQTWLDTKRNRVRVVQIHYVAKDGWTQATFTRGGFLKKPQLSPYLDEDDLPECQMLAVSAYIDRENNRYGVVRDMISPQDEVNKRRSKALHLISTRQIIAEKGAVHDPLHARKQLARPDGYVELNPGGMEKFKVESGADMAIGQFQLLQESKGEMDIMGPNATLQGKDQRNLSGRAMQTQQQGGLVELGPIFDQRRHWDWRVYKAVYNRIKQYWTAERWIRVTDDNKAPRFVGLNVPQTNMDLLVAKMQDDGLSEQEIEAELQQLSGHPDFASLQQPAPPQNAVAETDVDIKIEDAPNITTIQQEQFTEILSLASSGMVQFTAEEIIEMAPNLRNKRQMLEARRRAQEAQAAEAQEMKQIAVKSQELEMRKDMSVVAKNESAAVKAFAEARNIRDGEPNVAE